MNRSSSLLSAAVLAGGDGVLIFGGAGQPSAVALTFGTAVPEPSSLLALAVGGLGTALFARRRRTRN